VFGVCIGQEGAYAEKLRSGRPSYRQTDELACQPAPATGLTALVSIEDTLQFG
jgi:hypothetical protein